MTTSFLNDVKDFSSIVPTLIRFVGRIASIVAGDMVSVSVKIRVIRVVLASLALYLDRDMAPILRSLVAVPKRS